MEIIGQLNSLAIAGIIVGIVVLYLLSCIRFIYEYERAVIFRLGRVLEKPKGPGVILVFYPIDRMIRVSLRTRVNDVPSQDVITRDNVTVKVNAVVYFRSKFCQKMCEAAATFYSLRVSEK